MNSQKGKTQFQTGKEKSWADKMYSKLLKAKSQIEKIYSKSEVINS
jgi:hypothetical protein